MAGALSDAPDRMYPGWRTALVGRPFGRPYDEVYLKGRMAGALSDAPDRMYPGWRTALVGRPFGRPYDEVYLKGRIAGARADALTTEYISRVAWRAPLRRNELHHAVLEVTQQRQFMGIGGLLACSCQSIQPDMTQSGAMGATRDPR